MSPKPCFVAFAIGSIACASAQIATVPALKDPRYLLVQDYRQFEHEMPKLAPADAARKWLHLAERNFDTNNPRLYGFLGSLNLILSSLPSPETWPLIRKGLERQQFANPSRRLELRLLMDVIEDRRKQAWDDLDAIERVSLVDKYKFYWFREKLAVQWRDSKRLEGTIFQEIRRQSKLYAHPGSGSPSVAIPNLVIFVGENEARNFLTRILCHEKVELTFGEDYYPDEGRETENLARKIAIENKYRLAYPQWTLASSVDAGDLFEILNRRFPEIKVGAVRGYGFHGGRTSTYNDACNYEFIYLAMSGSEERTLRFLRSYASSLRVLDFPEGFMRGYRLQYSSTSKSNHWKKSLDNLKSAAYRYQSSLLSDVYRDTIELKDLPLQEVAFKDLVTWPQITNTVQSFAQQSLAQVLLSEGKYGDALILLRRLGDQTPPQLKNPYDDEYIAVGELLNRPDLLEKAVSESIQWPTDFPSEYPAITSLATRYGRESELEKRLLTRLLDSLYYDPQSESSSCQQIALELIEFYAQTGRYPNAVRLLTGFSGFNVPDLAYMLNAHEDHGQTARAIANSLLHVGREREALDILVDEIQRDPADDEGYSLLLGCHLPEIADILDRLHREFPANPQPLTWKANLLLSRGELKEAKALAFQAISLDPDDLDGWSKPTRYLDREVWIKAGGSKPSQTESSYRQAANDVHKAQRLERLQLLTSAIDLFKQALILVPNDLWTRVHLAGDLIELGQSGEGRHQMKLACEQIPSRLGTAAEFQVSVDRDKPWMADLEETLEAQVSRGNNRAGVYALLGLIKSAEQSVRDATAMDQRAVAKDRDCFPAWLNLSTLLSTVDPRFVPTVVSNCFRLSESPFKFLRDDSAMDFVKYWNSASAAIARRIPTPDLLLDFPATHQFLERETADGFIENTSEYKIGPPTPGEEFTTFRLFEDLHALIPGP